MNGSKQQQGISFDVSFALVADPMSVRTVICLGALNNMIGAVIDISNAFQASVIENFHDRKYVKLSPFYLQWIKKRWHNIFLITNSSCHPIHDVQNPIRLDKNSPPSRSSITFKISSNVQIKKNSRPSIFLPFQISTSYKICSIYAKSKIKITTSGGTIDTSSYHPGQMLHIDFTFYDKVSIRGFTCVLNIVDARTCKLWPFCTASKHPPIDIMRHFLHQLELEEKMSNL